MIVAYYIYHRDDILNDMNLNLDNKLVLLTILNHISVFFYINKEQYQDNYELIAKSINHIKDNIYSYRLYFLENNIFDTESFIGSISSGGLKQELYIIGNIVNDIYNNEILTNNKKIYK